MARLRICLLGSFQIALDGAPLGGFRSDKARAMLAYLVMEANRSHRRDWLASLFWGEHDDRSARRSLTTTLSNLRQILAQVTAAAGTGDLLRADAQTIQFDLNTSFVWVDTLAFTDLWTTCANHPHRALAYCQECAGRLEQAVQWYQGDFLAGFTVVDSPAFDEWRVVQAERLHQQAIAALDALTIYHQARRDFATAEAYARRQLALEPWREVAHRQLMTILAAAGQRAAALAQYEVCRRILRDELGAEPELTTTALFDKLRAQSARPWALGAPPLLALTNPYKGLQPFQENDALDFYGRESFVNQLATLVERRSFVAVVGPSGSGKSSLVHAGLFPRLRHRHVSPSQPRPTNGTAPASIDWVIAEMRPGNQPFQALAAALRPWLPSHDDAGSPDLADALQQGVLPLAKAAQQIIARASGAQSPARLLLLVEQFEELYTLCTASSLRSSFIDLLLAPSDAREPAPLTVLINLRADFMGQALTHRGLANALQVGGLVLGPMTRQELEAAIVRPAQAQGVAFQEGLVARILDDVGEAPGQLPLLEFALTQLWDGQEDGYLTHAAYEAIGRVEGALARYAEQVFASLTAEEQARVRRVFVYMVSPGQGTEDMRRPATRAELGEADWLLVQKLANARLVVTDQNNGQETGEIVHDALIRGWERLRAWLDADRAFRTWQQRMWSALAQWQASGYDTDTLLRGAPLAEAEEWAAARPTDLSPSLLEFLAASVAQRNLERSAAEAQRQRALADAQALAEAERRRAELEARSSQRLRWLAMGLTLVSVLALLALGAALLQSRAAQQQRDRARQAEAHAQAERTLAQEQARRALARQLAAQAINLIESQLDLALLLSLESMHQDSSPGAVSDLLLHLEMPPLLTGHLHGHSSAVHAVAISPDGQWLASGDEKGWVRLWNLKTQRNVSAFLTAVGRQVDGLAFSPDGKLLALGNVDGALWLWDVPTQQMLAHVANAHSDQVLQLVFAADGQTLITASTDGTLRRWQIPALQGLPTTLTLAQGEEIRAVSPDGQRMATVAGTAVMLRSAATGELLTPALTPQHKAAIADVEFSADGRTLVTSSFDGAILLWDVATGNALHPPPAGHTARVLVTAFSPDGRTLASGSTDATIRLWDVTTGELLAPVLTGHGNWVQALIFSPDGQTLFSAGNDGRIMVWSVAAHKTLSGHSQQVRGVAFSPDGRAVASGGFENTVLVHDASSGELRLPPLTGHTNAVTAVAYSPSGALIASGSAGQGDIILWDAVTGAAIATLRGHNGVVTNLLFSPDGRTLASASFDRTVILWDVAAGQPALPPLRGHSDWVIGLAFSPDGQTLASGGRDNTIRLWHVATGQPLGAALTGHSNWVTALAFSPDGRTLVSGSADSTLRLWDIASGQPRGAPLSGHAGPVWKVGFQPRSAGQTIISLANDGVVLSWDATTGQLSQPPLITGVETESMDIRPDGQMIAIGAFNSSGLVHLWQLPSAPWPARACAIANRAMLRDEWQKYLDAEPYHLTCPEHTESSSTLAP